MERNHVQLGLLALVGEKMSALPAQRTNLSHQSLPASHARRVLPELTKPQPVPPRPTLFVSLVLQVLRAWRA